MRLLPLLALFACTQDPEPTSKDSGTPVGSDEDGDGWTVDEGDCDDGDGAISPSETEICNGIDDNCDGQIDEEVLATFYADADGDGYGDPEVATQACEAGAGTVTNGQDCDDSNADISPAVTEVCNELDDDCDGEVDDGVTITVWTDADGDGFGDDDTEATACEAGESQVEQGGDCDDSDANANPDAAEVCDTADNDCDGEVDEDVASTWYVDKDGDGQGNAADSLEDCTQPTGYAAADTDCDDENAAIYAGATELCNGVDDDCDGDVDEDEAGDAAVWYEDADGDGYGTTTTWVSCEQPAGYAAVDGDCDDAAAGVNPGAIELCDGVDDDCDGATDEDDAADATTWYGDADGDGYGGASFSETSCTAPAAYVSNADDCDDLDAEVYPGATEYCDGVDQDCDGVADDGAVDPTDWYADADGDGYGDALTSSSACDAPAGHVADDTDCDDTAAAVNPGAIEACDGIDNDCDGTIDDDGSTGTSVWYADTDGDGYGDATVYDTDCDALSGYVLDDTDCDDGDAAVNPGATEVCNGLDDDCDGDADEASAADASTWYIDVDGDGYGNGAYDEVSCDQPSGYVSNDDDCNDATTAASPVGTEVCDTLDNDCDGETDEESATDAETWYADADGDGYGDPSDATIACDAPSGYIADDSDCDDTDEDVNPAETEACDGIDNDCDGNIDDDGSVGVTEWYADADGDGYGDASVTDTDCDLPTGYVADATDCDDGDPGVNPGAAELCNGVDDDCDGDTDEDSAADAGTWYIDVDGDGYGSASYAEVACDQPSGYVANDEDCNDATASANPAATEYCDSLDNDCDGTTDEDAAADADTWYDDDDGDGYGDPTDSSVACDAPAGHVADDSDCDDTDSAINPAASEVCDGVDNDCDGATDDDSALDVELWYADTDGDGYGDATAVDTDCYAPSGYVADDNDCDDDANAVNPGASEVCDGVDNDCDGSTDEDSAVDASTWYIDVDGDGYGSSAYTEVACDQPSGYVGNDDDCNDATATASPVGTEVCDGLDNDCDGTTDEASATDAGTWYEDGDGDGYGDASSTTTSCSQPSGYVGNDDDCDDTDSSISPAATETCDGVDEDCDGTVDNGASATVWYEDGDGDGYGGSSTSTTACAAPPGYVATGDDCRDDDPDLFPESDGTCPDGTNCQDIIDDGYSIGTGSYTIDPDYSGTGVDPFSVECQMTMDGGGWTQAIDAYLDTLSSASNHQYLYSYGSAWYTSPMTTHVWDWSSYFPLNGTYKYSTGSTSSTGSFECTHAESGDWGVGCSNGPGGTYKVLPIYYSNSSAATSMICQDQPDVFGVGACRSDASIWVRP
jgi:hypothetical protein